MTLELFKEQFIFNKYKDKKIKNKEKLTKEVKEKYGITLSSNLYTKIVNYQIKKYGKTLYDPGFIIIPKISRSLKYTRDNLNRGKIRYSAERQLEDLEKRKDKKIISKRKDYYDG